MPSTNRSSTERQFTNTNKLLSPNNQYYYEYATGMKTGYTSTALYCMSAPAIRGDMNLIAAVMTSESSDKRFADARKLLEYGFANYEIFKPELPELPPMKVLGGKEKEVEICVDVTDVLIEKGRRNKVEVRIEMEDGISAPFEKGTKVGEVSFSVEGNEISKFPIITTSAVERITFFDIFRRLLSSSLTVR